MHGICECVCRGMEGSVCGEEREREMGTCVCVMA